MQYKITRLLSIQFAHTMFEKGSFIINTHDDTCCTRIKLILTFLYPTRATYKRSFQNQTKHTILSFLPNFDIMSTFSMNS